MDKLVTISLNYSDGEKETINIADNTLEIIVESIRSALNGKTFYSIYEDCEGYVIKRKEPNKKYHDCVSNYRNGTYTWCDDYSYAKHFSKKTAVAHTEKLIK